jgi:L-fuconolactonase
MTLMATQVHGWSAEPPERSWPPGEAALAHRPTPLGRDELVREMDAASVDRPSIGLSSWEGDRNDLAMEAVLLHPARFAIMRRLAIEWPASHRPVDTWEYRAGMLGVCLTFHRGVHRIWLTDGTTAWFWAAAECAAIAVVVFAPGLLPRIAAVAARRSGLRLVLDYLALSGGIQDVAPGPAHRPALVLAQYPNVAVKATSLPSYFTEAYPHLRLHTHIRRVVEAYGPQRVFRGTDLARLRGSYCQVVTCRTEEMDFLSDIDTTWIIDRGIAEWLGWPLEAIRHTAEVKGVSWKPNVQFHSRLHRSRSRIGMA